MGLVDCFLTTVDDKLNLVKSILVDESTVIRESILRLHHMIGWGESITDTNTTQIVQITFLHDLLSNGRNVFSCVRLTVEENGGVDWIQTKLVEASFLWIIKFTDSMVELICDSILCCWNLGYLLRIRDSRSYGLINVYHIVLIHPWVWILGEVVLATISLIQIERAILVKISELRRATRTTVQPEDCRTVFQLWSMYTTSTIEDETQSRVRIWDSHV